MVYSKGQDVMFRYLRPHEKHIFHMFWHITLFLTLTFLLQGHNTIGPSNLDNLGIGEVSRRPRPVQIYVGHHDLR